MGSGQEVDSPQTPHPGLVSLSIGGIMVSVCPVSDSHSSHKICDGQVLTLQFILWKE